MPPHALPQPAPVTRRAPSLTPLDAALARLLADLRPVRPARVPLAEAAGGILAEPLAAAGAVPARALATRDGWAVASLDTVGASPYGPVLPATPPVEVRVGDPLPPGADAVLDPGDIDGAGPLLQVLAAAAPGQGARRPGEDARAGAVLRAAGEPLRPIDVVLARACGLGHAALRRPTLAVLAEAPDMIALAADALGALAIVEPMEALSPDLLVAIGDASFAHELERLQAAGGLFAHGIAMRPGLESACGHRDGVPVVLLPGRPEEAFAGLHLLVRPCLERLCGAPPRRPEFGGRLSGKIPSAVGLGEIAQLARDGEALAPLAVGDLAWSALAAADAWTLLPAGSEGHAPGETIRAFAL